VAGADTATLVIAAATNFVNYRDLSGDPAARVAHDLAGVRDTPYPRIREAHIAEHQRLFGRVRIDLARTAASLLPTDERLKLYAKGDDPDLAALLYQFGRYVLICSSRPGTQPANLQGIWNQDSNPWWDSKYTTNINLEMNYWPVDVANLSECIEPLERLLTEISRDQGARTAKAKVHYGARGWVLHQNTDLWRAAAPMDGPTWGTFTPGGAWLCTQLWDHFRFTGDTTYLKRVYPVMKGAAEFFIDFLVEHPTRNWLVTCPSTSPENFPLREGNGRYFDEVTGLYLPGTSICAGSTIDMQIVRDLFTQCVEAAGLLGRDREFSAQLAAAVGRLAPMQIGKGGRLQEWLEDWGDIEPEHRHVSHLYGLFPSNQITPDGTPELAAAARRSLDVRGDRTSGWALAWRVNLWARLLDGERAHEVLKRLIAESTFPNLFSRAGKALQIDGVLGLTSGIEEMVLHSHAGEIVLLPALPRAWDSGSVRGLRARGGFEVDIEWKGGRLEKAVVRSLLGNECKIRFNGRSVKFATRPGESYALDGGLNRI
jgi:alpha-L-fucosidase 2